MKTNIMRVVRVNTECICICVCVYIRVCVLKKESVLKECEVKDLRLCECSGERQDATDAAECHEHTQTCPCPSLDGVCVSVCVCLRASVCVCVRRVHI